MTYAYRARDPLGNLIEGTIKALSVEDATQQLCRDGFQVLSLEDDDEVGSLFPRRVSRSDVIYLTNQLAVMVDTGISLASALEGIEQQHENPTFRDILRDLRLRVEAGEDFSTALAQHPHLFDKTYVSLVKVSEATGTLGSMLDRISNYLRKDLEMRGKVRAAMAYPTVMLVLAIGVTIFLLTFVMPKFEPLFNRKGVQLPVPTRVAMVASDSLIQYWYAWATGGAALVVGFCVGRRTGLGRQALDWCKIRAPIVGVLIRKLVISRSLRTLGTMLSSGIPVLDALKLTSEVAGNYFYTQLWVMVSDRVTTGSQVHEALQDTPLVPPTLVQMISAGEQTGKLGPVLERVSNYYDQEVELSIKTVTSLIEPIMITVMGVVVGGIGLALLLPIFSLSKPA